MRPARIVHRLPRLAAVVLAAAACDGAAPAPAAPPAAPPPVVPQPAGPRFTDVSEGAGLAGHVLHAGAAERKNWVLETVGGGAACLDFDGDGDQDVLLLGGADMDEAGDVVVPEGCRTRLFENLGGLRFRDVTARAGIDETGYTLGCAAADFDGDGHVDVAVAGYDVLHLWRNRGDGTFEEVAAARGVVQPQWSCSASVSWGDLDGDGRLDLFVCRYVDQRERIELIRRSGRGPRQCMWRGMTTYCGPAGLTPQPNLLFFQRADGRFEQREGWCDAVPGPSLQALVADLDGDGDLDVYVANDGKDNELLVNDGTGRLANQAVRAGAAGNDNFLPQGSMGIDAADLDADGRPELAVANFVGEYNALYRNRTGAADRPLFEELGVAAAFSVPRQERVSWAVVLADFDGDARLDAYVTAGHVYPGESVPGSPPVRGEETPLLLRGLGGLRPGFADASAAAGPHFADARQWRTACAADFDDDGDTDLLVIAQQSAPALLRNDGGETRGFVGFDLRGAAPLTMPAGAVVEVTLADGRVLRRTLLLGSGYAGSQDPRLLFGLDGSATVRARVLWPGGRETDLGDVARNRVHVVRR